MRSLSLVSQVRILHRRHAPPLLLHFSHSITSTTNATISQSNAELDLSFLTDPLLHDTSNVVKLKHDYKIIYVLGVSHHSRLSALRVQSLCQDLWPDTVFLELCDKRLKKIRLSMALQSPLSHRARSLVHKLSNYSIACKYKHGPFIEAIRFADRNDIDINCGDIPSEITMIELQNALRAQQKPFEQIINEKNYVKFTFLNQVINEYMMYIRNAFNIGEMDVNILKRERRAKRKGVEKSRNEARHIVSRYSQTVYEILQERRDKFMVQELYKCPGDIIVAVVGIAHLDGIERYWNELMLHIHSNALLREESEECNDEQLTLEKT